MKKILLAGATGYLGGSFIASELKQGSYYVKAIARDSNKLREKMIEADEVLKDEVTVSESIKGCCEGGIDVVISTVGITRQKDGLTYMDVDYQGGNMNLLNEAKRSGVKKFIYVSSLNGGKLKHLKICHAKEKFVEELKKVRTGLFCYPTKRFFL